MNTVHIRLDKNEVQTLSKAVASQYDISSDTACDDIFISAISNTNVITKEELVEIRKSTSSRIDVLVVLTHTLAILSTCTETGCNIQYTYDDFRLLRNELDMYLSMINDMVGDEDGDIHKKVDHIVAVNFLLSRMNQFIRSFNK